MSVIIQGSGNSRQIQAFLKNSDLRGIIDTPGTDKTRETNPLAEFAASLEEQLDGVNETLGKADDKAEAFLRGEDTSIHEVMIAMSKADISFRLMTQIGKKVMDAYQEIQRMQV